MIKNLHFVRTQALLTLILVVTFFSVSNAQDESCASPANVQVSNVTMHEATLTWDGPADANSYELHVYGHGVYEDFEQYYFPQTNSITFEELPSNMEFEVRLHTNCPLYSQSWPSYAYFTTLPDCDPPTNFQFYTGMDSVYVTWDAEPSFGTMVSIFKGNVEIESYEATNNHALFYNLEANTIYIFRLVHTCPDGAEQSYSNQIWTLPNCSPMSNLQVTDITTTSVTVTWDDSVEGRSYEVTLLPDSGPTEYAWTNEHTASFENLQPGTEYQVGVVSQCGPWDFTPPFYTIFTTLPLCAPAENVQIETFVDSATVSWVGSELNQYVVTLYKDGIYLDWFSDSGTSSGVFNGLLPNTTYEVQMVVQCPGSNEDESWFVFTTLPAPVLYCSSNGLNSTKNNLGLVSFADINRSSGNDGGYSDNTSMVADVWTGESYVLTLGAGGLPNKKYISAWIDFNADGDFDDINEHIAYFGSKKNERVSTTVVIPDDAVTGTTRMRVIVNQHKTINACGSFAHGETEDYTIAIHPGTTPDAAALRVYPNPVTDALNFDSSPGSTITILNSTGAVMYSGEVPTMLPVSNWQKGLYYIIIGGDTRRTIRIAKN